MCKVEQEKKGDKWSKDEIKLRLEVRRCNGRRGKKMKRRWRPSGDCNSGYLKHMVPAGAAGGQLPAGIAAVYIIYFADLPGFFLL